MGTIITSLILVLLLFLIIRKMVKNKKSGKCSCGCESCAFSGSCNKEKNN